ncbi:hypothetical protein RRG08_033360 [Elysia crispata]|uniref:Uncharacterized protein n=1 Tax=Elysia crispata TaxID=231223 RepID=A0AAE1DCE4_9GAST|nr:hypothetical protein RRG08_033360 [Elysia crispata]
MLLLPGIFKLHIPGTKKNLNIRKKEMEERDQQIGCKRKASAETEACPSFKLQRTVNWLLAIGHDCREGLGQQCPIRDGGHEGGIPNNSVEEGWSIAGVNRAIMAHQTARAIVYTVHSTQPPAIIDCLRLSMCQSSSCALC